MNTEVSEFLHSIKMAFPVFHKAEKRFYSEFCDSVNDYVMNHPDCAKDDLENHFGTPKDIVITYYNSMDSDAYFTLMKKTHYIKRIHISAIFVLTIILAVTLYVLISSKLEYDDASIASIETTITESSITETYDD